MTDSASVEDAKKLEDEAGVVQRWDAELKAYEKTAKDWTKDAKDNYKRYSLRDRSNQPETDADTRFNILWSNVETQGPAVFSRIPVPVVERRYRDKDVVARVASQMLERAVSTDLEFDDLEVVGKQIRLDFLLTARAVPWVRYDPTIIESEVAVSPVEGGFIDGDGNPFDEAEEDEDGFMVRSEEVVRERAPVDYVYWEDFYHKPVKFWAELEKDGWVARRVFMTKRQIIERFGEQFRDVPLTATPKGMEETVTEKVSPVEKLAEIFEIWNAGDKQTIWIAREFKRTPLDRRDDPLGLEKFFPCPRPAYGSLTTDSLIPIPDYQQYQHLAEELDDLTERITVLTKALRMRGIYDSSMEGLGTLLADTGVENDMIAVSNLATYLAKGATGAKLQNVVQFFPVEVVIQVVLSLYDARERVKQTLFEISGLSDILRGQVDPREKLGQSRIKGQFATLRLDDRQQEIARMLRDVIRIKAEIIAEQFDDRILREISGFDQIPEIVRAKEQAGEQAAAQVTQQAQRQLEQLTQTNPTVAQQAGPQLQQQAQFTIQQASQQAGEQAADRMFAQAVQLIRDDKTRGFRIDIETDSTVSIDEEQTKEARIEFLTAAGGFLQQALPVVQQAPQMAPLLGDMLLFTVRGFKAGRPLEAAFEEFVEDLKQPQQTQQQPDPEMMKAQADREESQQKLELERQTAQQKLELEKQKAGQEIAIKREEIQVDAALEQMKIEANAQMQANKTAMDAQVRREIEAIKAQMSENSEARKALLEIAQTLVTVANTQQAEAGDKQAGAQTKAINSALGELRQAVATLSAPRRVVRDESGRAIGIEPA